MKKMIIGLLFASNVASAARLEDVRILNIMPGRDHFELKLQIKDGPRDSYFYVDIVKSDPDSFEKLVHVINKMRLRDKYKLDLDIPSFSASPSGSFYKSEGISFYGPADREPNGTSSTKKKK